MASTESPPFYLLSDIWARFFTGMRCPKGLLLYSEGLRGETLVKVLLSLETHPISVKKVAVLTIMKE